VTTVPWRIRFLGAALDALLAQTVDEFDVHVYVPPTSARTGEPYEVPAKLEERLSSEGRASLRHIDTDYGPATKLLAAYAEALSIGIGRAIVTVDDDVLLEPHAIEELLEAHQRHPGDALGFMGKVEDSFVHAEHLARRDVDRGLVGILGGYRAVLYPWDALDRSLFADLDAVRARCGVFLDDDHLIGWNLARRGVARRVVATRYPGPNGSINVGFLELPGPITGGPDGNRDVDRSLQCLRRYYDERGWDIPL
jgi:hypothetical protein